MKKSVVFNNQFTPKLGGQFALELVVSLLWNWWSIYTGKWWSI
ncbi:hypothetical protein [Flavobacterium galactosidilyticum]|nr:hypothetical protein [Flavobacterium sp. F-340]